VPRPFAHVAKGRCCTALPTVRTAGRRAAQPSTIRASSGDSRCTAPIVMTAGRERCGITTRPLGGRQQLLPGSPLHVYRQAKRRGTWSTLASISTLVIVGACGLLKTLSARLTWAASTAVSGAMVIVLLQCSVEAIRVKSKHFFRGHLTSHWFRLPKLLS